MPRPTFQCQQSIYATVVVDVKSLGSLWGVAKHIKKSLNIPKSMFFPHARVYVKFIEIKKSPLNVRISSSSFEVLEQRNYVVKSSDKWLMTHMYTLKLNFPLKNSINTTICLQLFHLQPSSSSLKFVKSVCLLCRLRLEVH